MTVQRPDVVSTERVHARWLGLRVDHLRFPSGAERDIDVVEHRGGVTIVAIDNDGNLLLVRQYRHSTGRILLELPAGTIDPGEDPEPCAVRELQEETGYKPARVQRLGGFFSAPGYCDEYLHVFLCTGLTESKLEGDEEAIEVERVPLTDALAMIAEGRIEDAKTAAGLLLYLQRERRL